MKHLTALYRGTLLMRTPPPLGSPYRGYSKLMTRTDPRKVLCSLGIDLS